RIAQDVLRVNPKHPIHHYVIHMWDNPDDYSLALPSADHSGFTEVGIAHLWHMAGHIYGHAKLPFEQWWSQEAAARVDHTYMRDMRVFPSWIHNHAHNNEWLSRTLMGIGSFEKARGFAYNMLAQPRHPKFNRLDQYMHLQNGIDLFNQNFWHVIG
ncbi:MAG: hypothetical protein NTV34_00165, partial [Proteobacteria bacterium]|nr:hypothetical protein [Pseudomonadota bacterium]